MGLLLLVLALVLLFGGHPGFSGHIHHMGYGLSGLGGLLVLIFIVLLLTGRI